MPMECRKLADSAMEPGADAIEMPISAELEKAFGVEGRVRNLCAVSLSTV